MNIQQAQAIVRRELSKAELATSSPLPDVLFSLALYWGDTELVARKQGGSQQSLEQGSVFL